MMYDQLLMAFGHYQTACGELWPAHVLPWTAIFMADWVRGLLPAQEFIRMMGLVDSDLLNLAECMVADAGRMVHQ